MTYRKKLIEVALPLEAINRESTRENYIYRGNPSAIHKWWAQRPLAACRAVLFSQLVDDPSSHPDEFPNADAQQQERQRLFRIIENLVVWENSNQKRVLEEAIKEIRRFCKEMPFVIDPFAGGGSIPLEAARLGLRVQASDLNPVAVLINKAIVEIPFRFANTPPVNPKSKESKLHTTCRGAEGLVADVLFYGNWFCSEIKARVGHLYPKVKLPKQTGGGEGTVIAWLWSRTVKCPNPACGAPAPLVKSFVVSAKRGNQVWVEPRVNRQTKVIAFEIRSGAGKPPDGTVNRRGARCLACGSSFPLDHVRSEGVAGRITFKMLAIAVEGAHGRTYVSPTSEHEQLAFSVMAKGIPETRLPEEALGFRVQRYGMSEHRDLFTQRQLVTLVALNDLVLEARERVLRDCEGTPMALDIRSLEDGGTGAVAYADALAVYLAFVCDKVAIYGNALVPWYAKEDRPSMLFGRQTISMVWDFAEVNPLASIGGSVEKSVEIVANSIPTRLDWASPGIVLQQDASALIVNEPAMFSTDPPYYDNVPYADLSDFFYIWLRRCLVKSFPDLFGTMLVPKSQELVADPFRYGSRDKAEQHFVEGITKTFVAIHKAAHPDFPVTVYYAFKQAEADDEQEGNGKGQVVSSTGWETMLEGLISAGFQITGTWPIRTERAGRLRDTGSNALASSIILVCRSRAKTAQIARRRDFVDRLRKELPRSLRELQQGNIAPVDLAQAAIGPGMALFSEYAKVLEADGGSVRVRTALQLINQELDQVLAAQEGEMDRDTRFCLAWFEQYGMNEGPYGEADVLARAKDTSVQRLEKAGVVEARGGKVRILAAKNLDPDRLPEADTQMTVWECAHHLIRRLEVGGEAAAARLFAPLGGSLVESARDLAYRLYSLCERKGWAEEARAYNNLIVSWPSIRDQAATEATRPQEGRLF